MLPLESGSLMVNSIGILLNLPVDQTVAMEGYRACSGYDTCQSSIGQPLAAERDGENNNRSETPYELEIMKCPGIGNTHRPVTAYATILMLEL